jgi:hypothetical protein
MLIDHLIYAHPDLDVAVANIQERFGVCATGGGRHPGRGTHNKLLALGPGTYLEVIAPDPGQKEPERPRPYGVEGITRGRLAGWAIASDDIDAAVASARSRGFDPGEVVGGERVTPAGIVLHWRLTANAQTAGLIPFLISWGASEHPSRDAPGGLELLGVWLEHPDPRSLEAALTALEVDVEVRPAPEPAIVARIAGRHGEQELR